MFVGHYHFTLDSKSRLTIPAKYRFELLPTLVVTRNPIDLNLLLLPLPKWEALAAKLQERPLTDRPTAELRRRLFSSAEDLAPDAQGRIVLSQQLRSYARIESDVVIAGMNDYAEIWNKAAWEAHMPEEPQLSDELLEAFARIGI